MPLSRGRCCGPGRRSSSVGALLSGAGIALYLILLDQYGPGQLSDAPDPVWFSPQAFKDRYALSEDTRAKGINDLQDLGLVTVTRQPINPGYFDLERIRNAYTLQPATLTSPATRRPSEARNDQHLTTSTA